MKITLSLLAIASLNLFAGPNGAPYVADNPLAHPENFSTPVAVVTPAVKDPVRIIGTNVVAVGRGWVKFSGKIWNVQPSGVCIKGFYTGSGYGDYAEGVDFFVANFPYQVAEDENISGYFAKEAGVYTYATAIGGTKTIRKLDYGAVYIPPPPTTKQIAAAKQAAEAKKIIDDQRAKAGADRALKANQDAADKGDAYGLLRMGERYRDGEGVEKDSAKARDFLNQAALKGSDTAQHELAALPQ